MPALRRPAAACVMLVVAAQVHAAPQVEADPHDLYERARARLAAGELKEAAAAIARVQSLIAARPDWDPEGVFADRLLPPLQARLERIVEAARRLDQFADRSLEKLQPPDLAEDISTVRDYTQWATEVIDRLREERDALVVAALPDPGERMIVAQTDSYRRTESLLQVDVLRRMAESAGEDILGLLGGDPRLESVLVRFRQLKRDLMQAASERDRLRAETAARQARMDAVLEALLEVVTDGRPGSDEAARQDAGVTDRFRCFLDEERVALERRALRGPMERDRLLADIARYRRYNEVLRVAGLGRDETARIDELARLAGSLRAGGSVPAAATTPAGILLPAACGLALATMLLGGFVAARRRRRRSLERTGRLRPAGNEAREADVDSRAA